VDPQTHEGGCLCGAVRYRHDGALRPIVACHCRQCRRTSGHYVAATQGYRERLSLLTDDGLRWYVSSPGIRRGFCSRCGSSLFWEREGSGRVSIMAGTLDTPTGLRMVQHIHTRYAGDYYEIDPVLPAFGDGAEMPPIPDDH